jgi:hypothetical protein
MHTPALLALPRCLPGSSDIPSSPIAYEPRRLHAPALPALPRCPLGWPRPHQRRRYRLKRLPCASAGPSFTSVVTPSWYHLNCFPCASTIGITSNASCVHPPVAYISSPPPFSAQRARAPERAQALRDRKRMPFANSYLRHVSLTAAHALGGPLPPTLFGSARARAPERAHAPRGAYGDLQAHAVCQLVSAPHTCPWLPRTPSAAQTRSSLARVRLANGAFVVVQAQTVCVERLPMTASSHPGHQRSASNPRAYDTNGPSPRTWRPRPPPSSFPRDRHQSPNLPRRRPRLWKSSTHQHPRQRKIGPSPSPSPRLRPHL